jgi:hypothetical protein
VSELIVDRLAGLEAGNVGATESLSCFLRRPRGFDDFCTGDDGGGDFWGRIFGA